MILPLCLMLSAPAHAGRRADRDAATEARLAALEIQLVQIGASRDALIKATADLEREIHALEARLTTDEAALASASMSVAEVARHADALDLVVSAPPSKKGKVDPKILAMQNDLLAMQAELAAMKKALASPPAPVAPPRPSSEDQTAASALLSEATAAVEAYDLEKARAVYAKIMEQYPETSAGRSSERAVKELAIVGQPAPIPVVTRWFSPPATYADASLTLVIFWEVWCPHCKREVPASVHWTEQYGKQGLQIIALTRLTKSATPEAVEQFIADNHLPFAVGQEDGAAADAFAVSGIPAAALVKDGVVVWRGHPARLKPELVERYLAAPPR